MPRTRVVLFRERDGSVPFLDWLDSLASKNRKTATKCRARLEWLREFGPELRRPVADYLRDGIYELRLVAGGVNYRILYFFSAEIAAVVSHGLAKESKVPDTEIAWALGRKQRFEADPERCSYHEEEDH